MRIGITGYTNLTDHTSALVYRMLEQALGEYSGSRLRGITCLAAGADQLFAHAVLAAGGTFEVILPATDYRDRIVSSPGLAEFDGLAAEATTVSYAPFSRSGRRAYMAASEELLRRSDLLFAVWDGTSPGRLGDTADVVRAAYRLRLSVQVLWPVGAVRT